MSIYEDARRTVAHPPETCTNYEAIFAREVVRLTESLQRIAALGNAMSVSGIVPAVVAGVAERMHDVALEAIANERTDINDNHA